MRNGFIKAAVASPRLRVGDTEYNTREILSLMKRAGDAGVQVLCFPELCLTGATCGDLFFQPTLLRGAQEGLAAILKESRTARCLTAVGLPVANEGVLYDGVAVVYSGEILGVVARDRFPRSGGVPLGRWFSPAPKEEISVTLCGQEVLLGRELFFRGTAEKRLPLEGFALAVEVGDTAYSPMAAGEHMAARGAVILLNPYAASETAGAGALRRTGVCARSRRLICAQLSAGAGEGESSTDFVFAGECLIAENGTVLAEHRLEPGLSVTEVDVEMLTLRRRRENLFPLSHKKRELPPFWIDFPVKEEETFLTRYVPENPFLPRAEEQDARYGELIELAARGLKKRLEHTGAACAVLGLSGGLDSTLALLTAVRAFDLLGRDRKELLTVTMPCFGTTDRTRDNAALLARELGTAFETVDISRAVEVHFADIGQDMNDHSVAFENGQARERTQVLMDLANRRGGLVIGTGDLSELALGWCTYNGDQMSMYSVNAGIPKTLVRHLVAYCANRAQSGGRQALADVLRDILATPVSPELLPPQQGEISQRTEDLVGPYELHDFFLYYALVEGFTPDKVYRLAGYALGHRYSEEDLLKWLKNFYRRFFSQQFKRSAMPDGPRVGVLGLSPRGDLVMPSDAAAALWLRAAEALS